MHNDYLSESKFDGDSPYLEMAFLPLPDEISPVPLVKHLNSLTGLLNELMNKTTKQKHVTDSPYFWYPFGHPDALYASSHKQSYVYAST